MSERPTVSIIIPHLLGDVLSDCLVSIYAGTHGLAFEVIVADDQPYDDGSLGRALQRFPDVRVVRTTDGPQRAPKGMGAGCNRGLEVACGRYAMLLNSDVEVTAGWLTSLVAAAESDERIAACQPKVRSMRARSQFDYGGAAGGMIDVLGFTFCRGRIFEVVEEDRGQYDQSADIFWAMGGAMLVRRSCLEKTGLMDEEFFMHMEEIDLCWRFHLAGFRVLSVPESVVYHHGGYSLKADSFRKTYLNHRNQLIMILKNVSFLNLAWTFPARVLLLSATLLLPLVRGRWKHPFAALAGLFWIFAHPLNIWLRRSASSRARRVSDAEVMAKMYRGSIVYQHFVKGVRTAAELRVGVGA